MTKHGPQRAYLHDMSSTTSLALANSRAATVWTWQSSSLKLKAAAQGCET